MRNVRFIGLDVHAETIAVAVAEPGGEVRSLGTIPNRPSRSARLIRKLGKPEQLRVCYEAGPTGYVLYWQLSELGVKCEVVAPTLVPVKAGDRVKTDRRDAEKLARCYRAGDLTPVWVPDAAHEALRDLVRARLAAKRDQLRARNRLGKFLLRHGRRAPEGTTAWSDQASDLGQAAEPSSKPRSRRPWWIICTKSSMQPSASRVWSARSMRRSRRCRRRLRAVIEALQSLRGIAKISAVSIMAEVGELSRFESARQLMGYSGAVSREHTERRADPPRGDQQNRQRASAPDRHGGGLGLSAPPRTREDSAGAAARAERGHQGDGLESAAPPACPLRAAHGRGKSKQQTVTAVGRELLGFIWAIGVHVERAADASRPRQAA